VTLQGFQQLLVSHRIDHQHGLVCDVSEFEQVLALGLAVGCRVHRHPYCLISRLVFAGEVQERYLFGTVTVGRLQSVQVR